MLVNIHLWGGQKQLFKRCDGKLRPWNSSCQINVVPLKVKVKSTIFPSAMWRKRLQTRNMELAGWKRVICSNPSCAQRSWTCFTFDLCVLVHDKHQDSVKDTWRMPVCLTAGWSSEFRFLLLTAAGPDEARLSGPHIRGRGPPHVNVEGGLTRR